MTEQQAIRIRTMRSEGMGYKAIGMAVGLSRDIVRNYCKSRGMAGYGKAIKRNIEEQTMLGTNCLYCGKSLIQPELGRKRKFCSEVCRREWWKKNADRLNKKDTAFYPAVCKHCGKEFMAYGNKNRKYCSHYCYTRERFWEE